MLRSAGNFDIGAGLSIDLAQILYGCGRAAYSVDCSERGETSNAGGFSLPPRGVAIFCGNAILATENRTIRNYRQFLGSGWLSSCVRQRVGQISPHKKLATPPPRAISPADIAGRSGLNDRQERSARSCPASPAGSSTHFCRDVSRRDSARWGRGQFLWGLICPTRVGHTRKPA